MTHIPFTSNVRWYIHKWTTIRRTTIMRWWMHKCISATWWLTHMSVDHASVYREQTDDVRRFQDHQTTGEQALGVLPHVERYDRSHTIPIVVHDHYEFDHPRMTGSRETPIDWSRECPNDLLELPGAVHPRRRARQCQPEDCPSILARPQEWVCILVATASYKPLWF